MPSLTQYGLRRAGQEPIVEKMNSTERYALSLIERKADDVAMICAFYLQAGHNIHGDVSDRIQYFIDKLDEGLKMLKAGE